MKFESLHQLLLEASSKHPGSQALLGVDKSLSFEQLVQEVSGLANGLRAAGLEAGQRVATSVPPHWDFQLTLALAKLGAVTVTVSENAACLDGLIHWHISDKALAAPDAITGAKQLVLDKTWIQLPVSKQETEDSFSFQDQDPFRLFLTSGTTGNPKLVSYSFGTIATKAVALSIYWHQGELEYNFMPLGSIGGFSTALSSLVKGVPFVSSSSAITGTLALLARNKISTITGSPYQIAGAVRALEENKLELPELKKIRLAGSFPTTAFRNKLTSLGVESIESVYGSTECGAVFVRDLKDGLPPEYLGEVIQGCEVRAVARAESDISLLAEKEFEYKTPYMFDGYLMPDGTLDPGTTNGWFRPGDRVRNASGKYLFVGRDDDLVNIGGVIFSALPVEEFAKSFPGVEDAVSFGTEDGQGTPIYALAVVAGFGFQLAKLSEAIKTQFKQNNPSHLTLVLRIPRNQMGKPLRFELSEDFKKRMASDNS